MGPLGIMLLGIIPNKEEPLVVRAGEEGGAMERRNTPQKEIVLEAVCKLKNHACADDVYGLVASEYPSISKGTVYRNLNILAEEGKIRKIEMPGGADRFDHIVSPHCHGKCSCCGKIFDIAMNDAKPLDKLVSDSFGFEITGYDILFKGICPNCK